MKFYIPTELTDPWIRESDHIFHGETLTIDSLAAEVDRRRVVWLNAHPGWSFTGTAIVKSFDGTPPPAYDVTLGFRRPRTPGEQEAQDRERAEYLAHKEADFRRREEEQAALLAEVLTSLDHNVTP